MVTTTVSCIMMMILNLIDRRGGFVEYVFVVNHPYTSQNRYLSSRIHKRHIQNNRCFRIQSFLRSRTYNYNIMSTETCYDYKMFYLEGYFSMISAFAFLVAFAIVFKRLGNTYKYYTATRYLSSYPDIVIYQYHYI